MSSHHDDPVVKLGADESWERLAGTTLGRLVTHVGEVIDIFPVNFVVDDRTIVFRTAEGSKLYELTVNSDVLFEADDHDDGSAWSVVVRGNAFRIENSREIAAADELPLRPWIPTLKYNYVRITPTGVSGRAFAFGEEPER
ncbi:pyridoxamine 5'-phosphate oxidase family protein [Pseudoclavibacter chungangensis]|uniref:Pyridoxamine 5'-phosphate oxidase family protein n=1 Tax=Pseudoclavibacter chungangensis TaxID=587635 RepID=A0A7J5BZK3_9MICO|nr:pyridoxamine 5'-phosphate oxidase family protein [Pseudoclavibacter chungangensis]KAB1659667.1 pyridoxamine 5'-phosphate oxidase family protein [Pseudoclavibacter chungangensis]NYJ67506.1 hypothetical protein [Pseudoclavibacter chungangensis]